MKQLLFLLLFPCIALAQYPNNGNQKITLGEQTSADGLVFRGNAADTVAATLKITKTNKSDTSAYLLLDTINNVFLKYNIGTTYWTRLNILPTDTASMLTNYYRAGRNDIIQAANVPTLNQNTTGSAATLTTGRTIQTNLASTSAATFNGSANITPGVTGTLPVANGGTGVSTLAANRLMVGNNTDGVLTPNELRWDNTNKWFGISVEPTKSLDVNGFTLVRGMHPSIFEIRGTDELNTPFGMGFTTNTYTGGNSSIAAIRVERKTSGSQATEMAFWVAPTGDNPVERLKIKNNGNIGISETNPMEKLHVVGNARITGVGTAISNNATLYITDNGTLSTNISDVNKKHNIRTLPYGLSTINSLKPVAFDWNESDETDIGFIAQDIENVIPESVITNWDSQLIFRQEKIIPVLVKAIQEQQALIKALEQRILILENK